MKMFYLIYHGRPNYRDKSVGGAMIGCWIETVSMYKADKIARNLIKEQSWDIIKKDRFKTVKPNSLDKESEHFKYYEQALIDKEVLVFYSYPETKKRTWIKK